MANEFITSIFNTNISATVESAPYITSDDSCVSIHHLHHTNHHHHFHLVNDSSRKNITAIVLEALYDILKKHNNQVTEGIPTYPSSSSSSNFVVLIIFISIVISYGMFMLFMLVEYFVKKHHQRITTWCASLRKV